MMDFHNTIQAPVQMLLELNDKNSKQNDIILAFFRKYHQKSFTPWQVHSKLRRYGFKYPITSVRRGISDLTDAGKLIMHAKDKQIIEQFGAPNNMWQFNAGYNANETETN